ncbi:MAG: bifunctional phosphopantothenoylcysteine decarboxylase/phosphopantothenate--cysteine ligase CoaBC, partial [Dehalococcoidales bacterium]|nr:bifunctional phosphopantothenoylcysteine decarboxylase/phosphopantothenate--cysteine ligase CoaBC [Dehalococcoidales bacterium]
MLNNKTIVLGITGGIAAYKAADIASKLIQAGARVEVVMTDAATKFITPLTLRNITGRPVVTDMFELASEYNEEHIALAEAADAVVIAPATANTIARLAVGIADSMVSTVVLATEAPVIIAPAMNDVMYQSAITQLNIADLKNRGFTFIEPGYGRLASGKIGQGRLADTTVIIETIEKVLERGKDLAGKRIVVTAGGTQEPIDPVRHIGNRSSGKMGYAIAEAARNRGADVTLITAPVALSRPGGMDIIDIKTVAELREAVINATSGTDALVMAAAVSDFRINNPSQQKIKKQGGKLTLELTENADFLKELPDTFVKVGFAAESENILDNARKKLSEKRLDFIVANDITAPDSGFDVDTNRVTFIGKDGTAEELP